MKRYKIMLWGTAAALAGAAAVPLTLAFLTSGHEPLEIKRPPPVMTIVIAPEKEGESYFYPTADSISDRPVGAPPAASADPPPNTAPAPAAAPVAASAARPGP
jgi:hypothetical protein